MRSFRLSPNEITKLINEEKNKLKIERLKQTREQAKAYSKQLAKNASEEKKRLMQLKEIELKKKWEEEHYKEIRQAEENFKNTLTEIGEGHRNAIEEDVDFLDEQKVLKEAENHAAASRRHKEAFIVLKNERELKESNDVQHFVDRASALDMEKMRAAMIASLPKPKPKPDPVSPPKPKTYPKAKSIPNVVVEKENINSNFMYTSAMQEALYSEVQSETVEERKWRLIKERRELAISRHNEALNREHLKKESEKMVKGVMECRQEELTAKKLEIDKLAKQVLVTNLKQKSKTEKPTHESEDCQETNSTSGLCSIDRDRSSLSGRISTGSLMENPSESVSGGPPSEAADDPAKDLQHRNETAADRSIDSARDDENQVQRAPIAVLELDANARKRLQEVVLRQQQMARKRDTALQVDISLPASSSSPDAKHQEVQVVSEELVPGGQKELDDGCSLKDHSIEDIRKKKQELIEELMAIEVMRSRLETPNVISETEICGGADSAPGDSKGWIKEGTIRDDSMVDCTPSDCGSFSSSACSSTRYLSFPPDASVLKSGIKSETTLCPFNNQNQNNMSRASSQKIISADVSQRAAHAEVDPDSDLQSFVPSLDSSLQSSFQELPSRLCQVSESSKAISDLQSRIEQNSIKSGGSQQKSVPSTVASKDFEKNFSAEDSLESRTLPRAADDQDSFPFSDVVELIDRSTSALFRRNSTIDVVSERASAIYFELQSPETESTTLSYRSESLPSNSFQSRISELLRPYNLIPSSGRGHSVSQSHSDLSVASDQFRHLFWDINNSTIDVLSERALHLSVKFSDLDVYSPRDTLGPENLPERDLSCGTDRSCASRVEESANGDFNENHISLRSQISNGRDAQDAQSNKCNEETSDQSERPTNWLNVLEAYRENSDTLCNDANQVKDSGSELNDAGHLDSEVENGILEEPDLTLVSCNTTTSMAASSLQNSGLQSSSLVSFEKHEVECEHPLELSTDYLSLGSECPSTGCNDRSVQDRGNRPGKELNGKRAKTASSSSSGHLKLMYPKDEEIHDIFKKQFSSWKNSRAAVRQDSVTGSMRR